MSSCPESRRRPPRALAALAQLLVLLLVQWPLADLAAAQGSAYPGIGRTATPRE